MTYQEVKDSFCKMEINRFNQCDKSKCGDCEFFEKKKFFVGIGFVEFNTGSQRGGRIGKEFEKLDDAIDFAKSIKLEDDDDGYELLCGVAYVVDNMGNDFVSQRQPRQ